MTLEELLKKHGLKWPDADHRDFLIDFINLPGLWPAWPKLYVKKREHAFAPGGLGYIVDGSASTVYVQSEDLTTDPANAKSYPSIEAMLDDGWTVD